MASQSPESHTKKVVFGAIGAAIIVVVFLTVHPLGDTSSAKKGDGQATSGASGTGPATGTAPASAASGTGAPTAEGRPEGSSAGQAPSGSPSAGPITSGAPVDMAQLLLEAKAVEAARAALAAGDPKQALKELEFYDKIPNAQSLRQEAALLKIEALSLVGRKSDALALALATRDDPSFSAYQGRIEGILHDAGH